MSRTSFFSRGATIALLVFLLTTPHTVWGAGGSGDSGGIHSLQSAVFSDMYNVINVTDTLTLNYGRKALLYYPNDTTTPLPSTWAFLEGLDRYLGSDGTYWKFSAPNSDSETEIIKFRVRATGPWLSLTYKLYGARHIKLWINAYSGGYQLYSYSYSGTLSTVTKQVNISVTYVDPSDYLILEFKMTTDYVSSSYYLGITNIMMFDKVFINNNYAHGVVLYNGSDYVVINADGSVGVRPINPNMVLYLDYLTIKARNIDMDEGSYNVTDARLYNLDTSAALGDITTPYTIYPEDVGDYTTLLDYALQGYLWIDGYVNGIYYTGKVSSNDLVGWLTVCDYENDSINVGKSVYYETTDSYGNVLSAGAHEAGTLNIPKPVGITSYTYIYDYESRSLVAYVSGSGESAVGVNIAEPAGTASFNASIVPWWEGNITIPQEVGDALATSPYVVLGLATLFLFITGRQYAGVGTALAGVVLAVGYLVGQLDAVAALLPMAAVPIAFGFWEEVKKK